MAIRIDETKYAPPAFLSTLMKNIEQRKSNGYMKAGTMMTEVVTHGTQYYFRNQSKAKHKKFTQGLFLYNMVRRDAAKFLRNNPRFRMPQRLSPIDVGYTHPGRRKLITYDLDHAYWRIAYLKGVISETTYTKGLPKKFKITRLAALSTLGRPKVYTIIHKGRITNQVKNIGGNAKLTRVFEMIRLTCYKHMSNVKDLLGDDFVQYRTDAITFFDTKENRATVDQYFSDNEFEYGAQ